MQTKAEADLVEAEWLMSRARNPGQMIEESKKTLEEALRSNPTDIRNREPGQRHKPPGNNSQPAQKGHDS
ncbi:MAG: hypothetical protein AB1714_26710 [Acidobacteriota bacterium]